MLAMAVHAGGESHLWLWPFGFSSPIPFSSGQFSDRDPDFSPDGKSLAFASNRGGRWDLYILDLASGGIRRLTDTPEFDGRPSYSLDGKFLAAETYSDGHFSFCLILVESGAVYFCSPDDIEAYEPSWSPIGGRVIAFTGRTGPHSDIYVIDLNTQIITNLSNTPDLDERYPAFSPDGNSLAFSREENGFSWIYTVPVSGSSSPLLNGQGDRPEWSPDGKWILSVFSQESLQTYLLFSPVDAHVLSPAALPVSGRVDAVSWTSAVLPDPVPSWIPPLAATGMAPSATIPPAGTPLSAHLVPVDVKAPDPRLSSAVVQRFQALRAEVKRQAGWDFLGTLDSAVVEVNIPMPPKEQLSWLRTGRAFAISTAAVKRNLLVITPDSVSSVKYWRLYVRTSAQDGTQGEPLRELPWNFDIRSSGTPSAYDNGGQYYDEIPEGYFIDFTQLAAEFEFQRIPSDPDWKTYYLGIHYWEFVCTDGLDWFAAMGELYPPNAYLTPTPLKSPTPRPTM
jgi:TolB protein